MKVCAQCKFHNPDTALYCLQCDNKLSLTPEQESEMHVRLSRLTNTQTKKAQEKLLNSWKEAIAHQFDWLWDIGNTLSELGFRTTSVVILLIILIAFIFLSFILNSLGH